MCTRFLIHTRTNIKCYADIYVRYARKCPDFIDSIATNSQQNVVVTGGHVLHTTVSYSAGVKPCLTVCLFK